MIGIWCYAADFARKYDLLGYFTGMFISNPEECRLFNFDYTEEEIDYQNVKFSNEIRRLIAESIPLNKWVETLQKGCDSNIDIVAFNYNAMTYLQPISVETSHATLSDANDTMSGNGRSTPFMTQRSRAHHPASRQ